MKRLLGFPIPPVRPYWQIPPNHTFKGAYQVARAIGGPWLELEACYGLSLLWLFARWSLLVDRLPLGFARAAMETLNEMAGWAPGLADITVSVWRPASPAMPTTR